MYKIGYISPIILLLLLFIIIIIYLASAAVGVDSNHITASSSALWSRFSPPSNFVNGHVSTTWFMVCCWPQSQEGDWARPYLCKLARHGPWPARKRFIGDHVWRGRSKPGCRIVGSVTIVWLTTEADDQSSLHCVIVSTDVMPDHIGRRDASRGGGCSKTSVYTRMLRTSWLNWTRLWLTATLEYTCWILILGSVGFRKWTHVQLCLKSSENVAVPNLVACNYFASFPDITIIHRLGLYVTA